MSAKPTIGVLALQGAVEPHRAHIEAAGGAFKAVKTQKDFEDVDAFILPGGESTTMLKLIKNFELFNSLSAEFSCKPVWGICAGAILMAQTVLNPQQKSFNLLPITIERNGYGRQLQSSHELIEDYEVSFIRAPVIKHISAEGLARATHNGDPVWIEHDQYMLTTFHPELTRDYPSPMHKAFITLTQKFYAQKAA